MSVLLLLLLKIRCRYNDEIKLCNSPHNFGVRYKKKRRNFASLYNEAGEYDYDEYSSFRIKELNVI